MLALTKLKVALNRLDHFGAPPNDSTVEVAASNCNYELMDQSEGLGHDMEGAQCLTLADLRELAGERPSTGDAYMDMLAEWEAVNETLSAVKERELDLRLKLFAGAFPNPKEGTNTWRLPDGRELKGKHNINRSINEPLITATLAAMREHGVANTDALIRYKPELAKKEWNSLSDEAKLIFSPVITAVPGTPGFEVVTPKRRGRS